MITVDNFIEVVLISLLIIIVILIFPFIIKRMKKENKRKSVALIAATVISLILLFTLLFIQLWNPGIYEIRIDREYSNENEYHAINVSEKEIDYGSIFNQSRFDGIRYNFIDYATVDYYNSLIEEKRKNGENWLYYFEYSAESNFVYSCRVLYNNELLTIISDNISYEDVFRISLSNGSMFAYYNPTDSRISYYPNKNYIWNFSSVYLIRMELDYSCYSHDHCAVEVSGLQYVILNLDFEPQLIFVKPSNHIVA